jgi:hypothetical protein
MKLCAKDSTLPTKFAEFTKGLFEPLHIGGMTNGRATHAPGWKWPKHVGLPSAA